MGSRKQRGALHGSRSLKGKVRLVRGTKPGIPPGTKGEPVVTHEALRTTGVGRVIRVDGAGNGVITSVTGPITYGAASVLGRLPARGDTVCYEATLYARRRGGVAGRVARA